MANNKFKPEIILTADEWKLVSLLNELLEPLYTVWQKCIKNNAIRVAVKCNPTCSSTKKNFNHKVNSPTGLYQSSSTILATLAENIEQAFEIRSHNNIL